MIEKGGSILDEVEMIIVFHNHFTILISYCWFIALSFLFVSFFFFFVEVQLTSSSNAARNSFTIAIVRFVLWCQPDMFSHPLAYFTVEFQFFCQSSQTEIISSYKFSFLSQVSLIHEYYHAFFFFNHKKKGHSMKFNPDGVS